MQFTVKIYRQIKSTFTVKYYIYILFSCRITHNEAFSRSFIVYWSFPSSVQPLGINVFSIKVFSNFNWNELLPKVNSPYVTVNYLIYYIYIQFKKTICLCTFTLNCCIKLLSLIIQFLIVTLAALFLPVQFENHSSINDGKAEQTDPSQENTPENTWIKILYHNLMRKDKNMALWNSWITAFFFFAFISHIRYSDSL